MENESVYGRMHPATFTYFIGQMWLADGSGEEQLQRVYDTQKRWYGLNRDGWYRCAHEALMYACNQVSLGNLQGEP